jgi:hypothetical protein
MKEIKLTNGKITLVDDEHYEYLNQFTWYEHSRGYVQTTMSGNKKVYMHRLINETPKGKVTDHINRDKKDNRKCNLRTCETFQNQQNTVRPLGAIKYRGVTIDKRKTKPYQARIKINGYHKHIGLFKTEEEAANAYNEYAYVYHGEFAIMNKIDPDALKHALHWTRYKENKL